MGVCDGGATETVEFCVLILQWWMWKLRVYMNPSCFCPRRENFLSLGHLPWKPEQDKVGPCPPLHSPWSTRAFGSSPDTEENVEWFSSHSTVS